MNGRGPDKKSNNKVLLIIAGIVALIVAVAVIAAVVIFSKGNAEESEDEIKESIQVVIEEKIEYGEDIKDKTFTFNTEDGEIEAKFTDLSPEVDTMKIGKTEHQLEMEDETFDVTIIVEDTKKPVISGVEDIIELEGEEVDIEKELKKLITAEDPVDGELEVVFKIEEDKDNENNYNVTAEATDVNDNKTTEKFKVAVKIVEKEEEKADKKAEEEKSSSEGTVAKSDNNTSTPKQEKKQEKPKQEQPKQEKPKQEKPKQEKPKEEKPKQESNKEEEYNCGGGVTSLNDPNPTFNEPPLNDPVGALPSGASLISKEKSYHKYSYKVNLPGGGQITEVVASYSFCVETVNIYWTDNNGDSFFSSYNPDKNVINHTYMIDKPTYTDDDRSVLFEVGRAFARSYGF